MKEFETITAKYQPDFIERCFSSMAGLHEFSVTFFRDVGALFDTLARVRNLTRNPHGFSIDDAPVLGLVVRISKLVKELVRYYELDNAEFIAILDRSLIESSVTASYLILNGPDVTEDYRKCSYKDRLRILRDLEAGSPFLDTKAGKRLLVDLQDKMRFEGLTKDDFAVQKKNHWKLQGRSFRDIFAEIERDDLYSPTYGMMSESIHGSWNESMDWGLVRNDDDTFSAFTDSHPADIRFMAPMLHFTIRPFRMWLERIDAYDDNIRGTMDWIERVNRRLFQAFDAIYAGEYDPKRAQQ